MLRKINNMKNFLIICAAVLVIALPFAFRRKVVEGAWKPGDPQLVVVTPHNEAIRQSFADGFSDWHATHYGTPVRIDWRVVGGTTEIMRYLAAEYAASAKQYFVKQGGSGARTQSVQCLPPGPRRMLVN